MAMFGFVGVAQCEYACLPGQYQLGDVSTSLTTVPDSTDGIGSTVLVRTGKEL